MEGGYGEYVWGGEVLGDLWECACLSFELRMICIAEGYGVDCILDRGIVLFLRLSNEDLFLQRFVFMRKDLFDEMS